MGQKCKNESNYVKIWKNVGGLKISWAPEGPQKGGKTTGMDIPEFRDINGPAPMLKNGTIGQIVTWGCGSPPPGIFRLSMNNGSKRPKPN